VIEVENVFKSYGQVQALRGVSFKVAEGEIVGMLGPNGAGKTTILKIITGYLQADNGNVKVDGFDVLTESLAAQSRLGYLPENAPLYPELNVQSYLKMIADIRHIPPAEQLRYISDAVHAVGLENYLTRQIGHLSKGYRQRVGLAQAILHKPRLLILDEPTVGLDPTQIIEIRHLIKRLAKQSTVLFSTHILPEVEALCDRVIIIMNGEIKADAKLSELATTSNVILVLEEQKPQVEQAIKTISGVQRVEAYTDQGYHAYRVIGDNNPHLSNALYQLAIEHKWQLRELKRDVRTLEVVFNELATGANTPSNEVTA